MLTNPIGILVLLVLVAPYIHGWLRVEVFFRTQKLDEELADAWFIPSYRHYIRYLEVLFFIGQLTGWSGTEEEKEELIPRIKRRLEKANMLPDYVLGSHIYSGTIYNPSKIRSVFRLITGQIKLTHPKKVS